jgi:hypothetical protein
MWAGWYHPAVNMPEPGERDQPEIRPDDQAQLQPHDLPALLWARAHHEAAHAVVGTLLGGTVSEAVIWSGPPVGGRVVLTGLDDAAAGPTDQYGLVRRIVYHLAGPIAEQIASGAGMIANEPASRVAAVLLDGVRDPSATGAASAGPPATEPSADLATVVRLLVDHFGPDGQAELAAAVDHLPLHVETLLRDRWGPVEVIAISLLRHGRLTEAQVRALFAEALPGAEMAALLDPSSA